MSRTPERGQLVLVAGAVVVVALVAVLGAVLQLGYQPGAAQPPAGEPVERTVERVAGTALERVAAQVRDRPWAARAAVAQEVRDAVAGSLEAVRGAGPDGVRVVTVDTAAATTLATERCPGGPARRFGPCEAVDGVVVQRRDGRVHVVAVPLSVTVRTGSGRTAVTVVVRPRPRAVTVVPGNRTGTETTTTTGTGTGLPGGNRTTGVGTAFVGSHGLETRRPR